MQFTLGADCVVRNGYGEVLLIKREDFRLWTIPGGAAEAGETPAQAAARETFEESGVEAAVDELVGVYTFGPARSLTFVYTGHPTGGAPRRSLESVDVGYFAPDALPRPMIHLMQERLCDALSSARGLFRHQLFPLWAKLLLPAMIRARKLRNWLQGRPEPPPTWRNVVAEGLLNGSSITLADTPLPGETIWDALRRHATHVTGQPVQVVRLLDVQAGDDPVVIRFALRVL